MKLQNKRTGEIKDWSFSEWLNHIISSGGQGCNLKEFIERVEKFEDEWEDYEETKEFWFIEADGKIRRIDKNDSIIDSSIKRAKEIGNYFETEEEAEKALEKLKAWKRLKDKGFRFEFWDKRSNWSGLPQVKALKRLVDIVGYFPCDIDEFRDDLDLLFGGEE